MHPASRILGVGYHVPPRVVRNEDLARDYGIDTSDEWIVARTGIRERHFVDPGMTNAELGEKAALRALENARTGKEEIDLILYATLSPDHDFPGTGCFLQARMGLAGVPAIDIRTQCTGFLNSLAVADAMIRSGAYRRVLVVGAEVHSHGLDLTTRGRDVAVLFGDGAGAAVVGAVEGPAREEGRGVLSVRLHADGAFARELWLEAPGCSFHPFRINAEMIEQGKAYPAMNGRTVFTHAVRRMPEVLEEALAACGHRLQDLDLLVPHQANLRINDSVAKALGLPAEKVFNTIDRFGNTTAATIPIGLAEAESQGKLRPGMLVGLVAFGSGFTWGAAILRW